jgi:quercetin dioxygenase-like cupin family protein
MKTPLLIALLALVASPVVQVGNAGEPPKANTGTAFDVLRSVNLPVGRKLRMCLHRIAPGEVIALRDHEGRPAVSYVIEGTMTLRQTGAPDQILHVGNGWARGKDGPPQWLVNTTNEPAAFVEADIFKPE